VPARAARLVAILGAPISRQHLITEAMATIELTNENFNATIENNGVVIVILGALVRSCRMFAPTFGSFSNIGVVFAKLVRGQELAAAFNIRSIPTLMVFREKVIIFSQAGMLPKAGFEQVVQKSLEVDMAKVHQEIAAQEKQPA
jgi:thioredoxin-like negative regulator of GroEL